MTNIPLPNNEGQSFAKIVPESVLKEYNLDGTLFELPLEDLYDTLFDTVNATLNSYEFIPLYALDLDLSCNKKQLIPYNTNEIVKAADISLKSLEIQVDEGFNTLFCWFVDLGNDLGYLMLEDTSTHYITSTVDLKKNITLFTNLDFNFIAVAASNQDLVLDDLIFTFNGITKKLTIT